MIIFFVLPENMGDQGQLFFLGENADNDDGFEDHGVEVLFPRTLFEAKDMFKRFVKEFRDSSNQFIYRERLQSNWVNATFLLEVSLQHLEQMWETLAHGLREKPLKFIPPCEVALQELYLELAEIEEAVRDAQAPIINASKPVFQLVIRSEEHPRLIRDLQSTHIEKLVCVAGIVIQASVLEHKATRVRLRCKSCGAHKDLHMRSSGKAKAMIPRKCEMDSSAGGQEPCGLDPYIIVSEECSYVDLQYLKIQELPEDVPTGEMPRSIQVVCTRYLADRLTAGTRASLLGIFSAEERPKEDSAVKFSYIHLVGFIPHTADRLTMRLSIAEEERFFQLARSGRARELIYQSIAPAIQGSRKDCIDDVKRAIACLLFGGSRKALPDGTRLRGDINVLLLGDPGTAKSQFLKYVEKAAPISVYTSGKGSSAAGLTAAVIRDASGRFGLEGGAMVLADGGCVCIDEFDKMRPDDRVAIHEAMEQQTISIAKAGITTVLNTRCAVLAAANPIFGTWSSLAETAEQMDFATTILSRFDLIFLVKDVKDQERDLLIANHVISLHASATGESEAKRGVFSGTNRSGQAGTGDSNEPGVPFGVTDLRKYINFCRTHCDPRLTERAGQMLQNHYVSIRKRMLQERRSGKGNTVPITVRQLEALVRISESLARMELSNEANEAHVEEAIRLFTLSTLDAANKNATGSTITEDDKKKIFDVEDAIRRRIHIGGKKSKTTLMRELDEQSY